MADNSDDMRAILSMAADMQGSESLDIHGGDPLTLTDIDQWDPFGNTGDRAPGLATGTLEIEDADDTFRAIKWHITVTTWRQIRVANVLAKIQAESEACRYLRPRKVQIRELLGIGIVLLVTLLEAKVPSRRTQARYSTSAQEREVWQHVGVKWQV